MTRDPVGDPAREPGSAGDDALPPVVEDPPLTYGSYLRVKELTSLQHPLSDPPHHDEMLFIVIHQVYELWFKQLLHEVDAAVPALDRGLVLEVHKVFKRVTAIQKVLIEQLQVLETMTPQDFEVFRSRLNPASGFQSWQFRALEIASGIRDPRYLAFHAGDAEVHAALERRLGERTIWDAFVGLLARRGFDVPGAAPEPESPDSARLVEALRQVYERVHDHYDLYLTAELLVDYDELFQVWRFWHVKMVERTIGARRGTGGSSGARYLHTTLKKRFFPELWEVRSVLGHDEAG